MKTKLYSLNIIGSLFSCAWICAVIVSIYFLYGALTENSGWINFLLSASVGVIAYLGADRLNNSKRRLYYVNQLLERGYTRLDADAAWRTFSNGGANLLLNLHQSELSD
jgi:steroid 5-alpha reductase family enzyme